MTESSARLLIVDDDRVFRVSTAALLRAEGHEVDMAEDGRQAAAAMQLARYDLLIVDLRMPGIDGVALAETLRLWGEDVPILMISGYGTVDAAVSALHRGVDDFLSKPVEPELLCARVSELLERRPRPRENSASVGGMVGRSEALQSVFRAIELVAPTDATVLISGETGTGKELVARALHDLSRRRASPFVTVNCAALAEGVLESELFGHVRGAFTGAIRDRIGLFEAAAGGTLFLDEIGEMSVGLQRRLLRVLQEREVVRVGMTRPAKVDVRVVAATNNDLRELVAQGRFRDDLLYRLAVFPIVVPPLRERPSDIPLLVFHGLTHVRGSLVTRVAQDERSALSCSPLAMRLLRAYSWPGNVRELFAVIESSAIRSGFGRIEAQHLPDEVRGAARATTIPPRYRHDASDDDERAAIVAALERTDGAIARAAELLGMGRTTLWRKIRVHGIQVGGSGDVDG